MALMYVKRVGAASGLVSRQVYRLTHFLPSMERNAPLSYSAAASSGVPPSQHGRTTHVPPAASPEQSNSTQAPSVDRRSVSPSHRPKGTAEDEQVYVLTLLTDQAQHGRMTRLRQQYFPRHLNKLEAHITLFHAVPGSRLSSSIIPRIQAVARQTSPFAFKAQEPFRLKRGVAISIAKDTGATKTQGIHRALQQPWRAEGSLSQQDAGGCQVHYTIMNKVDDERDVARVFREVQSNWEPDEGRAEGLGLWRYDRGFWRWERGFNFTKEPEAHESG